MQLIILQNHNMIKALMVKQHTNILAIRHFTKDRGYVQNTLHVQTQNIHICRVPIVTLR